MAKEIISMYDYVENPKKYENKDVWASYRLLLDKKTGKLIDKYKDMSEVRKIKKQECLKCKSKKKLEYHHIYYDTEFNPRQIIVLCHNCHRKEHKRFGVAEIKKQIEIRNSKV